MTTGKESVTGKRLLPLSLGALGVVYGDIGTSPLYALRECFHGPHGVGPTPDNVLGVPSLIFWSLILIISVKYLSLVMRADNKGEGGILALLFLAVPERGDRATKEPGDRATKVRGVLALLGLFGASLMYGDGIITPAISVLSAVEGLGVAAHTLRPFVLPITIGILVALFAVQHHGTGRVGSVFGPVMVAWFATLTLLGIRGIAGAPRILLALNPWYGLQFLLVNGWPGFVVIGAVFLVVTGGEALYADMGHFGARPIRLAWFALVLPALLINYLGQGALLLRDPGAAESPFYRLAPGWALYPLVVLATAATVIASQALISGAYSLTRQAIQIGYLPRMAIKHTSEVERGQIYMPHVNWALMVACIGLVLGFGSSSRLAAAYGVAVSTEMVITTCLLYVTARNLWAWSPLKGAVVCGLFLAIELAFFGANLLKVGSGGWFPLVIGLILYTFMATWKTGRRLVWEHLQSAVLERDLFFQSLDHESFPRVPGTAVYMAGNPHGTPIALLHNLKHNKVLHQSNILLTFTTEDVPAVARADRLHVEELPAGFRRVVARYGFMEEPNVRELLAWIPASGPPLELHTTTFFLSRETILPGRRRKGLARWRKWLFAVLSRNAQPATDFFRLPPNRVVELGMQIEL